MTTYDLIDEIQDFILTRQERLKSLLKIGIIPGQLDSIEKKELKAALDELTMVMNFIKVKS